MNTLTIPDLQQGHQMQTIRLRVTRIWNCIHTISRILFGTAFVGVDYQGNGVHVHIFEAHAGLFRDRLTEGNVYQMTDFIVAIPNIPDVVVALTYMIYFHGHTILHEVPDHVGIYDRHFFDFSGEDAYEQVARWETFLTDQGVVIFSGMRVRSYYGGITLTSTSATKVYVNLDIPKTSQAQRMFARMGEANGHLEGNN
ncbi:Nucleic acid-binding protein [Corchorus olitorius]|uniref:Nucleic acid-binding protein n=1 Tax=Corchorus olitorius TaxID=93759 RepID=A0A1R3GW30_9ROSI|nr:Nucleic acid-binding protein [Corchorus olitorius]